MERREIKMASLLGVYIEGKLYQCRCRCGQLMYCADQCDLENIYKMLCPKCLNSIDLTIDEIEGGGA